MLKLLLDENISAEVAHQVRAKRPDIHILSVHDWEDGRFRSTRDEEILQAAENTGFTLVTYDVNSIPLLAVRLVNEGIAHGGIVFIHSGTVRSNDIGMLIRALIRLYGAEKSSPWRNRCVFLPPVRVLSSTKE